MLIRATLLVAIFLLGYSELYSQSTQRVLSEWSQLNLPAESVGPIRQLVGHPNAPNLLAIATDTGVFVGKLGQDSVEWKLLLEGYYGSYQRLYFSPHGVDLWCSNSTRPYKAVRIRIDTINMSGLYLHILDFGIKQFEFSPKNPDVAVGSSIDYYLYEGLTALPDSGTISKLREYRTQNLAYGGEDPYYFCLIEYPERVAMHGSYRSYGSGNWPSEQEWFSRSDLIEPQDGGDLHNPASGVRDGDTRFTYSSTWFAKGNANHFLHVNERSNVYGPAVWTYAKDHLNEGYYTLGSTYNNYNLSTANPYSIFVTAVELDSMVVYVNTRNDGIYTCHEIGDSTMHWELLLNPTKEFSTIDPQHIVSRFEQGQLVVSTGTELWLIDIAVASPTLAPPDLVWPPNAFESISQSMELSWVSSESDAVFEIEVYNEDERRFVPLELTPERSSIVNSTCSEDGSTLRWRVRQMSQQGFSEWSATRTFSIVSPIDSASHNVFDEQDNLRDTVELSWFTNHSDLHWIVRVDLLERFGSESYEPGTILLDTISNQTHTTLYLQPEAQYYVNITAIDNSGNTSRCVRGISVGESGEPQLFYSSYFLPLNTSTIPSQEEEEKEPESNPEDEDPIASELIVYPNPAVSSFTISAPESLFEQCTTCDVHFSVVSSNGRIHRKGILHESARKVELTTSEFAPGSYFVVLQEENGKLHVRQVSIIH